MKGKSIKKWSVRALVVILIIIVVAVIMYCCMPRPVDFEKSGILIRSDGTVETTTVTLRGSWLPKLFGDVQREYSGTLEVSGLSCTKLAENWRTHNISYGDYERVLMGGTVFMDSAGGGPKSQGSALIFTDGDHSGYILLITDADGEKTWVIAPAQNRQQADALRDSWGLSPEQFDWQ
jgi:hypothetical protein